MRRKLNVTRSQEKWSHEVTKFRRPDSMKLSMKHRKASKIASKFKWLKTRSKTREGDETKAI